MTRPRRAILTVGILLALQAMASPPASGAISDSASRVRAAALRYPLLFTENAGQWDAPILYCAQRPSGSVRLLRDGIRILTGPAAPRATRRVPLERPGTVDGRLMPRVHSLRFAGASPRLRVEAAERAPGGTSFYLGDDPARWREGVSSFGRIVYRDVWTGVDVAFAGRDGALKANLTLRPGARMSDVRFTGTIASGDGGTSGDGAASGGAAWTARPAIRAWQHAGGVDVPVAARIERTRRGELRIAAAPHDPALPLQVAMEFSTYFAGRADDEGGAVLVDDDGNMYIAGMTESIDLPRYRAEQWSVRGRDVFLAKFAEDGRTLLFSTYYGGNGAETDVQAKPGRNNGIVLVGSTTSTDFPLKYAAVGGARGHFIGRFDSSGHLLYSSYLWDDGLEDVYGMTTDACGAVYIVADTKDYVDPPIVTPDALYPKNQGIEDLFIMKINPGCDTLLYATCLGGPAHEEAVSIAVDREGNIIVAGYTNDGQGYPVRNALQQQAPGGQDVVLTKLRADGRSIIFSTFLGGSSVDGLAPDPFDAILATDDDGNIYIAGETQSADFPLKRSMKPAIEGPDDIFLAKFSPAGALIFSTLFGGAQHEYIRQVAVDACGNPALAGTSDSENFPPLVGSSYRDGAAFIALFDSAGSRLTYTTRWGSPWRHCIAVNNGFLYVTGKALGHGNPPVFNAYRPDPQYPPGPDAFLSRLAVPDCVPAPRAKAGNVAVAMAAVDTVHVQEWTSLVMPDRFTLSVTLRNTGAAPVAGITGKLKLPRECSLEPAASSPTVAVALLRPGDSARFSWTVDVDTVPPGAFIAIRFLVTAADLSADPCATGLVETLAIPVLRHANPFIAHCALYVPDTLARLASGLGYDPDPFPLQFSIQNMAAGAIAFERLLLALPGGMGLETEQAGDTLRPGFILPAGQTRVTAWSLRARTRTQPRNASITVTAINADGEALIQCGDSIAIPALEAMRCSIAGPDSLAYDPPTGRPVDDSVRVVFALENPLDTMQRCPGAVIDLSRARRLLSAAGREETLTPFDIPAHAPCTFTRSFRISGVFTRPDGDTLVFRYRTSPAAVEQSCAWVLRFKPLPEAVQCLLEAPAALSIDAATTRYAGNPFTARCIVRNATMLPADALSAALRSSDTAAAQVADPARRPVRLLQPGEADTLAWTVTAATSRFERAITLIAAVTDSSGLERSRCTTGVAFPAIDEPMSCALDAPATIRYDQAHDLFTPDTFAVTVTLENRLDTVTTMVDAEIDLAQAPRLGLTAGDPPRKRIDAIAPHGRDSLAWLLALVAPDTMLRGETVAVRYRTAEDTRWRSCSAVIVLQPRKKDVRLACATLGHDTVWTDAAYGGCIPLPLQIRYTIRNLGVAPLALCSAAILPPRGYRVAPGTDSVQSYGGILPQGTASREWLLTLDPARARCGKDSVRWAWGCEGVRLDTSCAHEVTLLARPPDGLVFTPWTLRFRAERNGPLPPLQQVRFWTGLGVSVAWQLQPTAAWLDVDPRSGDLYPAVAAQPNTTALALGEHAGAIEVAARTPMFRRNIEVFYDITLRDAAAAPSDPGLPVLEQQYPNPVRDAATVVFRLPAPARATLALHDALGRRIVPLIDAQLDAGEHRVALDAVPLAPGVYILVLQTRERVMTRIVTVQH